MFVGTFEHSLDDKGRLVLPTSFRGRLTDGGFLAQHENCLALWSGDEFRTFVERVMDKQRNQEVTPDAVRVLTASAAEAKPDGQGRISIPPRLRSYAELSSEVVLIGGSLGWSSCGPFGDRRSFSGDETRHPQPLRSVTPLRRTDHR